MGRHPYSGTSSRNSQLFENPYHSVHHRRHHWQPYSLLTDCGPEGSAGHPSALGADDTPQPSAAAFLLSSHNPTHSAQCLSNACKCNKKNNVVESAFSYVGLNKERTANDNVQSSAERYVYEIILIKLRYKTKAEYHRGVR